MSGEATARFRCFGGDCAVFVSGATSTLAPEAVVRARRRMLDWHARFSRFAPDSELSRCNRDPRSSVPASAVMLRVVVAALEAARSTGGLIDPTLLPDLRVAGYARSREDAAAPAPLDLHDALAEAPVRRPASPRPDADWREISIDSRARAIVRPPGLELDLGGIAKGVFGDLLAEELGAHDSFAVDAAGDVRFGGRHTLARPIAVAAPSGGGGALHTFHLEAGAAATSGIGRRLWRDAAGRPAHHLLDPGSGRAAFTGVVQVTALAATGAQAETRAKAALLCGPGHATDWLPDGGVIVADDGTVTVIEPSLALTAPVVCA